jgi:peroxiredoxin Q/BCP
MTAEIGQPAPDFTLPCDEDTVSLADFRGKRVVLYFYPKDDTSGCTSQAKALRDDYHLLAAKNAEVLGVSRDSVASHIKFRAKHSLPFRLGADVDGKVCEDYGVWKEKSMYGKTYMGIERSTFLIDENGIIRAIWRKVKVASHVADVVKDLNALA